MTVRNFLPRYFYIFFIITVISKPYLLFLENSSKKARALIG